MNRYFTVVNQHFWAAFHHVFVLGTPNCVRVGRYLVTLTLSQNDGPRLCSTQIFEYSTRCLLVVYLEQGKNDPSMLAAVHISLFLFVASYITLQTMVWYYPAHFSLWRSVSWSPTFAVPIRLPPIFYVPFPSQKEVIVLALQLYRFFKVVFWIVRLSFWYILPACCNMVFWAPSLLYVRALTLRTQTFWSLSCSGLYLVILHKGLQILILLRSIDWVGMLHFLEFHSNIWHRDCRLWEAPSRYPSGFCWPSPPIRLPRGCI